MLQHLALFLLVRSVVTAAGIFHLATLHAGSRGGATGVSSAHVQSLQDVAGIVSNDAVVGDWQ